MDSIIGPLQSPLGETGVSRDVAVVFNAPKSSLGVFGYNLRKAAA